MLSYCIVLPSSSLADQSAYIVHRLFSISVSSPSYLTPSLSLSLSLSIYLSIYLSIDLSLYFASCVTVVRSVSLICGCCARHAIRQTVLLLSVCNSLNVVSKSSLVFTMYRVRGNVEAASCSRLSKVIRDVAVDFGAEWKRMPDARDLVTSLLKKDGRIRISAEKASLRV